MTTSPKQGGNSLIGFSSVLLVLKSDVSETLTVTLLFWATWANRSGRSFVKSDGSELLNLLLKKERMSEERRERFALGHKKGGKLSKT